MSYDPIAEVSFVNIQQTPVQVILIETKCVYDEHDGTQPSDLVQIYSTPGDQHTVFLDPDVSGSCFVQDTILRYQVITADGSEQLVGEFSLTCSAGNWSYAIQPGTSTDITLEHTGNVVPFKSYVFVFSAVATPDL